MSQSYQNKPEIRVLTPPLIGPSRVMHEVTQIRPYRRNGIRNERESKGDKIIYHNYGHGGAGGSVFYGSATIMI